jgi:hypothetical protein
MASTRFSMCVAEVTARPRIDPHPPSAGSHFLEERQDGLIARTPNEAGPEDDGLKASAVLIAHGLLRQGLGPAVGVGAVEGQWRSLIDAAQMLAADYGGFRPHVNEAAGASLLGRAEHAPSALHVDAIPDFGRSPLLDEGGAVNHDLGASDIGSDHRTEIAPDGLAADGGSVLI